VLNQQWTNCILFNFFCNPLLSLYQTAKRTIKRKHFTALQTKEMQRASGPRKTTVTLNLIYVKYISCTLNLETLLKLKAVYKIFCCIDVQLAHFFIYRIPCRSRWPYGLRRGSVDARLLGLGVRIPPVGWMAVCCECCEYVGRDLCDWLILCSG